MTKGPYSEAFIRQLKEDCPSCKWWNDQRPLPPDAGKRLEVGMRHSTQLGTAHDQHSTLCAVAAGRLQECLLHMTTKKYDKCRHLFVDSPGTSVQKEVGVMCSASCPAVRSRTRHKGSCCAVLTAGSIAALVAGGPHVSTAHRHMARPLATHPRASGHQVWVGWQRGKQHVGNMPLLHECLQPHPSLSWCGASIVQDGFAQGARLPGK
jgi:hypothetical protein